MKWRRRHIFLCFFLLIFFAVRVLHRRNSPHWNRIKDYKRPSKTPRHLPHLQYTKKCMGCVSTFCKPSEAVFLHYLYSQIVTFTAPPIWTYCGGACMKPVVDFTEGQHSHSRCLLFNSEGQLDSSLFYWRSESNTERFVQKMSSFIFKALVSCILCSVVWQRRLNMNYGLAVHGHRCCGEKMTPVQIGICIIFQEIIIAI